MFVSKHKFFQERQEGSEFEELDYVREAVARRLQRMGEASGR